MASLYESFDLFIVLLLTVGFLAMLLLGILYSIGRTRDILRKLFPQSTEPVKNATLTCEHGHKARVYIHIPGWIIGDMYPRKDDKYWVDPKHCPICGGSWMMPDKYRYK
jgi:ribosomal protein S27AE